MSQTIIGIDAGGTLTKIAYNKNGHIHYKKFPTRDMNGAIRLIQAELDESKICLTGGKAHAVKKLLDNDVEEIPEFTATCRGALHLAKQQGLPVDGPFILANVGTGTSIHYVDGSKQERVTGSGVGGGTLVGLANLLIEENDFGHIVKLAADGNRSELDLQVKDIYSDTESPILGSLTASNFGKAAGAAPSDNDRVAAIAGMVSETVTLLSTQTASHYQTSSIVYIGSTLYNNDFLKELVRKHTKLMEKKPFFLENGELSGALGALLAIS